MSYRRVCDGCGTVAPPISPPGWVSEFDDGRWTDHCATCMADRRIEAGGSA